jgi:TetR/AcrR family transcriptional repressor of nem operon
MRKSKADAARTRQRIVETAAAEFRQHGIAATGLADLMAVAGLTHGGFYRHFDSKDQLVAEATAAAVGAMSDRISAASSKRQHGGLKRAIVQYLSTAHRDNPREGCPLAALGSEFARSDNACREVVTEGFFRLVATLASQLEDCPPEEAKAKSMAAALMMLGAITASRIATDDADSKSILQNAQRYAIQLLCGQNSVKKKAARRVRG